MTVELTDLATIIELTEDDREVILSWYVAALMEDSLRRKDHLVGAKLGFDSSAEWLEIGPPPKCD